jgi:hypothetical protein
MGLLEDLSSGKYNLVLFAIIFILFFHLYSCKHTKEPMADVSIDIKEAVKQIYLADVEAIRNLSEVATKLQTGALTIPGDLVVKGQIKADKNITSGGEINNTSFSLSGLNSKADGVQNSLNNTITNVNNNFSSMTNLISQINLALPVFVRFILRDPNSNITSHEWVFSMDSELMLVWHNGDTTGVRNKVVDKARRLGYSLPLTRVKVPPFSWDFRDWTSFILSVPNGKSVRIFSWGKGNPDNDKTYGPGVHYVEGLRLPTQGGFHGIWAGLESKKYELIPQGYCVSDMYNL